MSGSRDHAVPPSTPLAAIAKTLTAEGIPTSTGKSAWFPTTVASALKSAELDAYAAARRR